MRKVFIVAILTIVYSLAMQAQTVIDGTVLDSLGQVVEAYVTVSTKNTGTIIGFGDADNKGYYKVELNANADSLIVTASGLAIGNHVRIVANRSQRLDFRVKQQSIDLKEVTVRAPKIQQFGDTINYNVATYIQQNDRVIADVLKKMPGIEVSDGGAIKFNGKSISKFYVEDMDLLQGRYGIATNNINASDVSTVQVLENHQPIKALQNKTVTDDVAINLKLKNSAKGTMAVNAMLGAGGQQAGGWGMGSRSLTDNKNTIGQNPLWAAEVVGMYFAKQRQNMTLYKGNNTGDDVSRELTQHYSGLNSVGLYPFCPMGAVMPSGVGLSQKRTFDNHSHIITINHLEKLNNDVEVVLNAGYHNDRIRREGTSSTDRFVSDDQRLQTQESLTSETHLNNLNVELLYRKNAEGNFLTNGLKFNSGWNADNVVGLSGANLTGLQPIDYGNERIKQRFDRPQLSVSNTLNTLRNFGNRTFLLRFSGGYAQRPNALTVGVDSLIQGTTANYEQALTSRHIAGNFNTSLDFNFGAFKLSYGVTANASMHGIETELDGFVPTEAFVDSDLQNDLWYNTYELVFGQHYTFRQAGWRVNLGCPINLYTQTLDDRIRNNYNSYTHLLVSPSFSTHYERRDWSGSVNANYDKTVGDPGGIYAGYIMNNYRSFQRSYVNQLSETDRISTGANIAYRNALTATFFRLNAGYTHTSNNQIYGYYYQGATSVVQAVDRKTNTDSYTLGFDGSKGFDWLQATIRAFGGYGYSTSEQLIDQKLYPFHSRNTSFGAGGAITPLPWLNFVVSSGYSWNMSQTNSGQDDMAQTVRSATQRIKVNIFATRQLTLTASVEDNYNNLTDENRHVWFGDIQAKYKWKRVDLELQLNNLFDQRTYTRVSYTGLDIYSSTAQLRPRNVLATVRFKLL